MTTPAPWSNPADWHQVQLFFQNTLKRKSVRDVLKERADEITHHYLMVGDKLHELCSVTCCSCDDVCCVRATVWYDFRDLLLLSLLHKIPLQQIRKTDAQCPHLTPSGCRLERIARPFLCTWYVCPTMVSHLQNSSKGREVIEMLRELQMLRKNLEEEFIHLTS